MQACSTTLRSTRSGWERERTPLCHPSITAGREERWRQVFSGRPQINRGAAPLSVTESLPQSPGSWPLSGPRGGSPVLQQPQGLIWVADGPHNPTRHNRDLCERPHPCPEGRLRELRSSLSSASGLVVLLKGLPLAGKGSQEGRGSRSHWEPEGPIQ